MSRRERDQRLEGKSDNYIKCNINVSEITMSLKESGIE